MRGVYSLAGTGALPRTPHLATIAAVSSETLNLFPVLLLTNTDSLQAKSQRQSSFAAARAKGDGDKRGEARCEPAGLETPRLLVHAEAGVRVLGVLEPQAGADYERVRERDRRLQAIKGLDRQERVQEQRRECSADLVSDLAGLYDQTEGPAWPRKVSARHATRRRDWSEHAAHSPAVKIFAARCPSGSVLV